MDTKKLIFFGLTYFSLSCSSALSTSSFKSASEETLFKNFILASCIGHAYEDSDSLEIHVGSALNGYREFSHISLEAYEEGRELIEEWLKKDYKSKSGEQLGIMKCIDLYNHSDLDKLFSKFDPCHRPDAWISKRKYKSKCGG